MAVLNAFYATVSFCVFAERDVNLVGCLHEVEHFLLAFQSEAACVCGACCE